jgi:hypothetical protein
VSVLLNKTDEIGEILKEGRGGKGRETYIFLE